MLLFFFTFEVSGTSHWQRQENKLYIKNRIIGYLVLHLPRESISPFLYSILKVKVRNYPFVCWTRIDL